MSLYVRIRLGEQINQIDDEVSRIKAFNTYNDPSSDRTATVQSSDNDNDDGGNEDDSDESGESPMPSSRASVSQQSTHSHHKVSHYYHQSSHKSGGNGSGGSHSNSSSRSNSPQYAITSSHAPQEEMNTSRHHTGCSSGCGCGSSSGSAANGGYSYHHHQQQQHYQPAHLPSSYSTCSSASVSASSSPACSPRPYQSHNTPFGTSTYPSSSDAAYQQSMKHQSQQQHYYNRSYVGDYMDESTSSRATSPHNRQQQHSVHRNQAANFGPSVAHSYSQPHSSQYGPPHSHHHHQTSHHHHHRSSYAPDTPPPSYSGSSEFSSNPGPQVPHRSMYQSQDDGAVGYAQSHSAANHQPYYAVRRSETVESKSPVTLQRYHPYGHSVSSPIRRSSSHDIMSPPSSPVQLQRHSYFDNKNERSSSRHERDGDFSHRFSSPPPHHGAISSLPQSGPKIQVPLSGESSQSTLPSFNTLVSSIAPNLLRPVDQPAHSNVHSSTNYHTYP